LADIVSGQIHDRTIYWIWEEFGNTGKSAMVKHLVVQQGALLLGGKGADIKYMIATHVQKKKIYPRVILYDIPRTIKDYVSYTSIEEVKNACFCSSKYESTMVVGNAPHFICMANFPPEEDKLSRDRWDIKEIIDKDFI
jgi:hypothetical protein